MAKHQADTKVNGKTSREKRETEKEEEKKTGQTLPKIDYSVEETSPSGESGL